MSISSPNGDLLEELEMRVAVRGVDRDATLARIGRAFDMARPERERLAAAAREHDSAGMDTASTPMRATGQVSAHDHGFVSRPVAMVSAKARSSRICASIALA